MALRGYLSVMATEAGEAGGAFEDLAGGLVDLIDAQIRRLIAEGAQEGAMAADRVGRAARTLILSRKTVAAATRQLEPAHPNPAVDQGDDDEDAIEPPRDDDEGRALRAKIIRGLDRLVAEGKLGPDPSGVGTAGPEGDGGPILLRLGAGSDTS